VGPLAHCPTRYRDYGPMPGIVTSRVPPQQTSAGTKPHSADVDAEWTSLEGGDHVPSVSLDNWSRNSGRSETGPGLPAVNSDGREFRRAVSVPADAGPSIVLSAAAGALCCCPDRDGAALVPAVCASSFVVPAGLDALAVVVHMQLPFKFSIAILLLGGARDFRCS
jgi:hypothetical protein